MKIKVSVPATSANVGSGFDALGLAVTLYNTVTFEESDKLDISAADGTRIPRNESNLVYRSAKGCLLYTSCVFVVWRFALVCPAGAKPYPCGRSAFWSR